MVNLSPARATDLETSKAAVMVAALIALPLCLYAGLAAGGLLGASFQNVPAYTALEIAVAFFVFAAALIALNIFGRSGFRPALYMGLSAFSYAAFLTAALAYPPDSTKGQWLYFVGSIFGAGFLLIASLARKSLSSDPAELQRGFRLLFLAVGLMLGVTLLTDRLPGLLPEMVVQGAGLPAYGPGTYTMINLTGLMLGSAAVFLLRTLRLREKIVFKMGLAALLFATASGFGLLAGGFWNVLFWLEKLFSLGGAMVGFYALASVYRWR